MFHKNPIVYGPEDFETEGDTKTTPNVCNLLALTFWNAAMQSAEVIRAIQGVAFQNAICHVEQNFEDTTVVHNKITHINVVL